MSLTTSTEPENTNWYGLFTNKMINTFPNFCEKDFQKKNIQEIIGSGIDTLFSERETEIEKQVEGEDKIETSISNLNMFEEQRLKNTILLMKKKLNSKMPKESIFKDEKMDMNQFIKNYLKTYFPKDLPMLNLSSPKFQFTPSMLSPISQFFTSLCNFNNAESETSGDFFIREHQLISILFDLCYGGKLEQSDLYKTEKANASGLFTFGGTFNLLYAMKVALIKSFGTKFKTKGFFFIIII